MILLDHLLHCALIGNGEPLGGEALAGRPEAGVVHGALQSVVLPAEDVVAVLAVSGATCYRRDVSYMENNFLLPESKTKTHVSPLLRTRGWEPSAGQSALLVYLLVSQTI